MAHRPGIRAILFDTFGTVVDWRTSIISDLGPWARARGLQADWALLADLWRGQYEPQKDRVRRGDLPWTRLDELHRDALDSVLDRMGLSDLSSDEREHINAVWHRLQPWPDAVPGLQRLRRLHVIGPLSNGNVSLLVNMARHAALPWDVIFSAEHFRRYKPDPETYLGACRMLDLSPEAVVMCAAHNDDLRAARALGLKTAFIARPTEYGPGPTTYLAPTDDWDFVASDIVDLATQMDA